MPKPLYKAYMKKCFFSLLLATCSITAFSQYNFTLDISTKTLRDRNVSINIFKYDGILPIKIDSFIIKNGHHIYHGQVNEPSNYAAFYVSQKGKTLEKTFMLDSGLNTLTIDLPSVPSRYLSLQSDARGQVVYQDLTELSEKTIAAYKKGPTHVNGYLRLSPELFNQLITLQSALLTTYPNDFASLIYLYRLWLGDIGVAAAKRNLVTLAKLSQELQASEVGKKLYDEQHNFIQNKILAGQGKQVLNFTVSDLNNQAFSNSSLLGQPYLIVFSATWCGPCQEELPELKKIYTTYKSKGLKVIYFNDDDDIARWKAHVSSNQLSWINVSERLKPRVSKIPKSFGIYAIPTCILVNKSGTIVYNSDETDTGLTKLNSQIKKLVL